MIDGGEVEFVVERDQDLSDYNISEYIPDDHLEIGESVETIGTDIPDRPGNRNKSYSRKGCANHAKGNQEPV